MCRAAFFIFSMLLQFSLNASAYAQNSTWITCKSKESIVDRSGKSASLYLTFVSFGSGSGDEIQNRSAAITSVTGAANHQARYVGNQTYIPARINHLLGESYLLEGSTVAGDKLNAQIRIATKSGGVTLGRGEGTAWIEWLGDPVNLTLTCQALKSL